MSLQKHNNIIKLNINFDHPGEPFQNIYCDVYDLFVSGVDFMFIRCTLILC